jgi:hypothetical protein
MTFIRVSSEHFIYRQLSELEANCYPVEYSSEEVRAHDRNYCEDSNHRNILSMRNTTAHLGEDPDVDHH